MPAAWQSQLFKGRTAAALSLSFCCVLSCVFTKVLQSPCVPHSKFKYSLDQCPQRMRYQLQMNKAAKMREGFLYFLSIGICPEDQLRMMQTNPSLLISNLKYVLQNIPYRWPCTCSAYWLVSVSLHQLVCAFRSTLSLPISKSFIYDQPPQPGKQASWILERPGTATRIPRDCPPPLSKVDWLQPVPQSEEERGLDEGRPSDEQ